MTPGLLLIGFDRHSFAGEGLIVRAASTGGALLMK
jgi:hypothetical protein